MLPASFAADVPVFMATPTSACASAGASLVPSPVIATRPPPSCSRRMRASLSSGVASASKSSTPASAAIACAVSGLSPVTMTVRMPIARSVGEPLLAGRSSRRPSGGSTPSSGAAVRVPHGDRRAGCRRCAEMRSTAAVQRRCARAAARRADPCGDQRSRRPCACCEPSGRSRPLIRVWAVNGTTSPAVLAPASSPRLPARSTTELPSGVGSASEASAAASTSSSRSHPGSGRNSVAGGCRR